MVFVEIVNIKDFGSMRIIIAIIIFFNSTLFIVSGHKHKKKKNITLINSVDSVNSFISYVMFDGNRYIFKQKKDITKQFSVVRDALAAYIAHDLNIAHSVEIISSKIFFSGKNHAMAPGVLLTIAAGDIIRNQPESKYFYLCLKQRNVDGDLLPHRWLTETIINQITWHKQLPVIIGLDLFLCNTDRHGGNLFYDSATDSFCAIDMDTIFRRDLPALACAKLRTMIDGGKQFTYEEIEALKIVRDTIQFLLDRYSARKLIKKLYFFIKQAEFSKKFLYTEKMAKKIARHEAIIIQSRVSAYELIIVLNKIINNF